MWPSDAMSLFGSHDRNKSPLFGIWGSFPSWLHSRSLGCHGPADIHVSSLLQIWSGCWFFSASQPSVSTLLQFGVRLHSSSFFAHWDRYRTDASSVVLASHRIFHRISSDQSPFILKPFGMQHAAEVFLVAIRIASLLRCGLRAVFMGRDSSSSSAWSRSMQSSMLSRVLLFFFFSSRYRFFDHVFFK